MSSQRSINILVTTILSFAVIVFNSDSAQPQEIAEQNSQQVITTIADLLSSYDAELTEPLSVDITATLGFYNDDVLHVQHDGQSVAVEVDRNISPALQGLKPGARLRIQGHTVPGSDHLAGLQIDILATQGEIDTVNARGHHGQAQGPPQPKPYQFCKVRGHVRQILRRQNRALIALHGKGIDVHVEVCQRIELTALLALLDKRVEVRGTLTRPNQTLRRIMLIDLEQIVISDHENPEHGNPPSASSELTVIKNANVLFTDRSSQFIVETDRYPGTASINSQFANRIIRGSKLDLYTVELGRDRDFASEVVRLRSQLIDMRGLVLTPQVTQTTLASHLKPGDALPSRIRLRGRVETVVTRNPVHELNIMSDGVQVRAQISAPPDALAQYSLTRHDQVTLTGVPLWKYAPRRIGPNGARSATRATELILFVSSADDVVITTRPISINRQIFAGTIAATLVLAIVGLFWTRTLRHQVAARTATLNAVTSHLATSFEAVQESILINDEHLQVSQVNEQFNQLFGFSPVQGTSVNDCLEAATQKFRKPDLFHSFWTQHLEQAERGTAELKLGSQTVLIYASPILDATQNQIGNLWSFKDITQQRRLEHELLQSQKMEAVGQLSGGIAHDFNNLLMIAGSNMSVLKHELDKRGLDLANHTNPIETAVNQAADLTRQLLDFSHKSNLEMVCVDANELVERVYRLARRTIDSSIHFNLFLLPQPLPVQADVSRIEQVLLNLCINARDSMPHGRGNIRVRTLTVDHHSMGTCVCIEFEDDGQGMSLETRQKIFEPFFTTKKRGTGTGLGLSTAMSVVQQHGGELDCESEWGTGSTFRILLPGCEAIVQPIESSTLTDLSSMSNSLSILLVDDEELLRQAGKKILTILGHQVTVAANGYDAIQNLETTNDIDVVLLDLTMPKMSGSEAYQVIRKRWPQLPVIICSGYAQGHVRIDNPENDTLAFLPKPYQLQDLRETLSQLTGRS